MARAVRCLSLALCAGALWGQQTSSAAGLTVAQAVEEALRAYPSIRVTQEQMNAAAAGIRLAQTAYLPRVDGLAQINRATRNSFYGMMLPQGVIPNLAGVAGDNSGSVWDSGVGLLVTWQPFDFGLRAANVAIAEAERGRTQAALNRTRLDVSTAAADAFLTVIAAQQTAEAARAAAESWQVLLRSIHALTAAQLRPGADESRVQAELAAAQTQLAQAEQAVEVARATLGQFLGAAPPQLDSGKLVDRLPGERTETPLDAARNPLAIEQNAAVAETQQRLKALDRSYYPQFLLQGLASARGTGLLTNGERLGGLNGLAPNIWNYGLGLTVTFPAMDRLAVREQEAAAAANVRAGQAQSSVIALQLEAQFNAAQARLAGARRVAANTPPQVAYAQTALEQATARYRAGLDPIDGVAQAERLLAQSRIDNSLARLGVWRARLAVEATRGDIQPFLTEASQ